MTVVLSHHPRAVLGLASSSTSTSSLSSTSNAAGSSLKLQNPSLVPDLSPTTSSFAVYNPANPSQVVGHAHNMGREEAAEAIDAAHAALDSWRDGTSGHQREKIVLEWNRLILENAKDIAQIMTLESGKPLAESMGEISYACSFLEFFAAEAVRPTSAGGGTIIPTPFVDANGCPRGQLLAVQQAIGVAAFITPWNFPLAMITRKAAAALAAGCTCVVKPSELTPLTAVAVQELALQAGIPKNAFQIVTADRAATPAIGTELCTNPLVQKVSFTGSVPVGKHLYEQCSGTVKKISLELGGNAPFIVCKDADIDQAVEAAMASKFRNSGQTCVCADRFLIHTDVYDEFVSKLVSAVNELKVGNGMDESTTMGPLINAAAVESVEAKVAEAVNAGAKCLVGGTRLEDMGGHYYAPTVLSHVPLEARIWSTETFGPVVALNAFESDAEALEIANDSAVGLAGYVCTRDVSRVFSMTNKLECGLVGVNAGIMSTAYAPFGGVKESGLGREGSSLGIAEYLETKYIYINTD